MEKTTDVIYQKINNDFYNSTADIWWTPDTVLHLLKTSVNPWRVCYSMRVLRNRCVDPKGKTALEVGCGGGILTEEIRKLGFTTTGIDPSELSLHTAAAHAAAQGLNIQYDKGAGEALPYADASFDCVFCCDVLEHVRDLAKVIAEIARVLKPGGVFFYDTLNRTFISKLVAIKIWQEWPRWAFFPPHLHEWEMFIRPAEIKTLLAQYGLEWQEHHGSSPNVSIPRMLHFLRKRARGEWTFADLGRNFWLVESKDMRLLYAGHAIKG